MIKPVVQSKCPDILCGRIQMKGQRRALNLHLHVLLPLSCSRALQHMCTGFTEHGHREYHQPVNLHEVIVCGGTTLFCAFALRGARGRELKSRRARAAAADYSGGWRLSNTLHIHGACNQRSASNPSHKQYLKGKYTRPPTAQGKWSPPLYAALIKGTTQATAGRRAARKPMKTHLEIISGWKVRDTKILWCQHWII